MPRLARSFFERSCLRVAQELLGCTLVRVLDDGARLSGRLVEVEAYIGDGSDPGSHSHRGPTPRNRTMFGPPGRLYAYRSYGIHTCVNLVCEPSGRSGAVLLRAMEPLEGIERMCALRGLDRCPTGRAATTISSGPGRLAQALGLELEHDGMSILGRELYVLAGPGRQRVTRGLRVGLTQGADLPYRFHLTDSPWVSPWRPGRLKRRPAPPSRA